MLKKTDKVVYELQTEKGLFIVTVRTEDKFERYIGRTAYDIEFKLSEKSGFTSFFYGSWLQENETIEEFLVRTNRLILNTNHFDSLIETHKEEFEILEHHATMSMID